MVIKFLRHLITTQALILMFLVPSAHGPRALVSSGLCAHGPRALVSFGLSALESLLVFSLIAEQLPVHLQRDLSTSRRLEFKTLEFKNF